MLIEVKAIGIDLKEPHVKQAIDYAANQGVEWVVLTNGLNWRVYKVIFGKPIGQELVLDLDFCALNGKAAKDVDTLFLFCKEGWMKSVLGEYHTQKQALSRFFLGAMILSEPVLNIIRRELKRLSPDVRVEVDEIKTVLMAEVLKREVLEGDSASDAKKKIARSAAKQLREKSAKTVATEDSVEEPPADATVVEEAPE
jgi:predicted type IV restriction endonuclease